MTLRNIVQPFLSKRMDASRLPLWSMSNITFERKIRILLTSTSFKGASKAISTARSASTALAEYALLIGR